MGINSVRGFGIHAVGLQDVGIAWECWLVAIPIVIVGARLGAHVCSFIKRDYLIVFLLLLIGLEPVTTLWLIPFNRTVSLITGTAVGLFGQTFWAMIHFRQRTQT